MSSLLRTAIATIAINSLIWQPFVLSAQEIQAMGGTNVGQTSYGVPLININAPSASGVSQNQYQNFNVNSYGAVFNNATQDTTTVIGGDIRANKNFNGSSAKIILNEVKGTSASNLNGYMEVGGDKADVVIANPNGITCNGCGYVNTANATLTTGSAQMDNGAITGYNVQGGTITINGDGLDASRTDKADLISRAVKLNASIYANKLNVKTGANNPITPAPNVSIDSAALGGMYANSINIQGTENGVGINLPEAVVSGSGGVTINANGKITVANVSSAGDVTIHAKAADIDVKADKQVRSMQQASLTGDNVQLSSGSAIVTGQQLSIRANNITNKGDLTAGVGADDLFQAGGNISIDASNAVHNQGKAFATSAINVRAKSLVNEDQLLSMGAQTLLIDEAAANRGEMSAGGDLEVSANNIDNQGKISSGASVAVSAVSAVQNLGEIEANNTITIEADKVLNNQLSSDGEGLLSAGIVYINAAKSADIGASINAQILNIASEGDVTAKSDINANIINVTANNVALGSLSAKIVYDKSTGEAIEGSGSVYVLGNGSVVLGQTDVNKLTVSANNNISTKQIKAEDSIQLYAENGDSSVGALSTTSGNIQLTGNDINITGNINSAGEVSILAGDSLSAKDIAAGKDVYLQSENNSTVDELGSLASAIVFSGTKITFNKSVTVEDKLNLSSSQSTVFNDELNVGGDFVARVGEYNEDGIPQDGSIIIQGQMNVVGDANISAVGAIEVKKAAHIDGNAILQSKDRSYFFDTLLVGADLLAQTGYDADNQSVKGGNFSVEKDLTVGDQLTILSGDSIDLKGQVNAQSDVYTEAYNWTNYRRGLTTGGDLTTVTGIDQTGNSVEGGRFWMAGGTEIKANNISMISGDKIYLRKLIAESADSSSGNINLISDENTNLHDGAQASGYFYAKTGYDTEGNAIERYDADGNQLIHDGYFWMGGDTEIKASNIAINSGDRIYARKLTADSANNALGNISLTSHYTSNLYNDAQASGQFHVSTGYDTNGNAVQRYDENGNQLIHDGYFWMAGDTEVKASNIAIHSGDRIYARKLIADSSDAALGNIDLLSQQATYLYEGGLASGQFQAKTGYDTEGKAIQRYDDEGKQVFNTGFLWMAGGSEIKASNIAIDSGDRVNANKLTAASTDSTLGNISIFSALRTNLNDGAQASGNFQAKTGYDSEGKAIQRYNAAGKQVLHDGYFWMDGAINAESIKIDSGDRAYIKDALNANQSVSLNAGDIIYFYDIASLTAGEHIILNSDAHISAQGALLDYANSATDYGKRYHQVSLNADAGDIFVSAKTDVSLGATLLNANQGTIAISAGRNINLYALEGEGVGETESYTQQYEKYYQKSELASIFREIRSLDYANSENKAFRYLPSYVYADGTKLFIDSSYSANAHKYTADLLVEETRDNNYLRTQLNADNILLDAKNHIVMTAAQLNAKNDAHIKYQNLTLRDSISKGVTKKTFSDGLFSVAYKGTKYEVNNGIRDKKELTKTVEYDTKGTGYTTTTSNSYARIANKNVLEAGGTLTLEDYDGHLWGSSFDKVDLSAQHLNIVAAGGTAYLVSDLANQGGSISIAAKNDLHLRNVLDAKGSIYAVADRIHAARGFKLRADSDIHLETSGTMYLYGAVNAYSFTDGYDIVSTGGNVGLTAENINMYGLRFKTPHAINIVADNNVTAYADFFTISSTSSSFVSQDISTATSYDGYRSGAFYSVEENTSGSGRKYQVVRERGDFKPISKLEHTTGQKVERLYTVTNKAVVPNTFFAHDLFISAGANVNLQSTVFKSATTDKSGRANVNISAGKAVNFTSKNYEKQYLTELVTTAVDLRNVYTNHSYTYDYETLYSSNKKSYAERYAAAKNANQTQWHHEYYGSTDNSGAVIKREIVTDKTEIGRTARRTQFDYYNLANVSIVAGGKITTVDKSAIYAANLELISGSDVDIPYISAMGSEVKIDVAGDVLGMLSTSSNLATVYLAANEFNNLSYIRASGDATLVNRGNSDLSLSAQANNLNIYTGGGLRLRETVIGNNLQATATGDFYASSIKAGNNATVSANAIEMRKGEAGGNLTLIAQHLLAADALSADANLSVTSNKGSVQLGLLTHSGAMRQFHAGDNLTVSSRNDLAMHNASLSAGADLRLTSHAGTVHVDNNHRYRGVVSDLDAGDNLTISSKKAMHLNKASLTAGASLTLNSGDSDLSINKTKIDSAKAATLQSGRDILLQGESEIHSGNLLSITANQGATKFGENTILNSTGAANINTESLTVKQGSQLTSKGLEINTTGDQSIADSHVVSKAKLTLTSTQGSLRLQQSDITASDLATLKATKGDIDLREVSAKGIELDTKQLSINGDIQSTQGITINADGLKLSDNVAIKAENNLIINILEDDLSLHEETDLSSSSGAVSIIVSKGSVSIGAGSVIQADSNLTISAENENKIGVFSKLTANTGALKLSSKNSSLSIGAGNVISAGADLDLIAKKDIKLAGATQVDAEGNALIKSSEGSVILDAHQTELKNGHVSQSSGFFGSTSQPEEDDIILNLGDDRTLKVSSLKRYKRSNYRVLINDGNTINVGGNLNIRAQNNIELTGGDISVDGMLSMKTMLTDVSRTSVQNNQDPTQAGLGSIILNAMKDEIEFDYYNKTKHGWELNRKYVTVNHNEEYHDNIVANISAAHGITLSSANSIALEGAVLTSDFGSISLDAENKILLDKATDYDEYFHSRNSVKRSLGVKRSSDDQKTQIISPIEKGATLSASGNIDILAGYVWDTEQAQLVASDYAKNDQKYLDRNTQNYVNSLVINGGNIVSELGNVDISGHHGVSIDVTREITDYTYSRVVDKLTVTRSGNSLFAGRIEEETHESEHTNIVTGSLIGSTMGDLSITSGGTLTSVGASMVAGKDIHLYAENINLLAAENKLQSSSEYKRKATGVTLSVGGAVGDVYNYAAAAERNRKAANATEDERVKKLRDIARVRNVYDATKTAWDAYKNPDKSKLWSLDISLGVSETKSSSSMDTTYSTGGSLNSLWGDIYLTARSNSLDDKSKGNINIIGLKDTTVIDESDPGSSYTAAGIAANNITIYADNNINIEAVHNTTTTTDSNESKRVSVGASTSKGSAVTLSVNASDGESATVVNHVDNTTISATETLEITAGGDLTAKGANLSGYKVDILVMGDMLLESSQESVYATVEQNSKSASVSVSQDSVTGNAGYTDADGYSNYISVNNQSSIKAGDGGYNIEVVGDTELIGAKIVSTASADKKRLVTGTFNFSALTNFSEYHVESDGANIGNNGRSISPSKSEGDSDTTYTQAVLDGKLTITKPAQQSQSLDDLDTSDEDAHQMVKQYENINQVMQQQQDMVDAENQAMAAAKKTTKEIRAKLTEPYVQAEKRWAEARVRLKEALAAGDIEAIAAAQQQIAQENKIMAENETMHRLFNDDGAGSMALDAAIAASISGEDFEQQFFDDLQNKAIQNATDKAFERIGHSEATESLDIIPKTLLHALVGGLSAKLQGGDFDSAALATAVGHLSAELLTNIIIQNSNVDVTNEEEVDAQIKDLKEKLKIFTQLLALGVVYADNENASAEDINLALDMSESVVENNFQNDLKLTYRLKLIEKALREGKYNKETEKILRKILNSTKSRSLGQKSLQLLIQGFKQIPKASGPGTILCMVFCFTAVNDGLEFLEERNLETISRIVYAYKDKLVKDGMSESEAWEYALTHEIPPDYVATALRGLPEGSSIEFTDNETGTTYGQDQHGSYMLNSYGQKMYGVEIPNSQISSAASSPASSPVSSGEVKNWDQLTVDEKVAIYDEALDNGKYIDPLTGRIYDSPPANTPIHSDHIYPKNKYGDLTDYGELTRAEQIVLEKYLRNRQAMEGRLNCSKGQQCSTDGTTWKTYKGKKIDGDYAEWLAQKQKKMKQELERIIQEMLNRRVR